MEQLAKLRALSVGQKLALELGQAAPRQMMVWTFAIVRRRWGRIQMIQSRSLEKVVNSSLHPFARRLQNHTSVTMVGYAPRKLMPPQLLTSEYRQQAGFDSPELTLLDDAGQKPAAIVLMALLDPFASTRRGKSLIVHLTVKMEDSVRRETNTFRT
jgi:hypothetical protein